MSGILEVLGEPLRRLWKLLLDHNALAMASKEVQSRIVSTWSTIANSLQSKGTQSQLISLLPSITPFLVATVKSSVCPLAEVSFNFWAGAFSRVSSLRWPREFVEAYREYSKNYSSKNQGTVNNSQMEDNSDTVGSDLETNTGNGNSESEVIVHPNKSPMKVPMSPFRKSCIDQFASSRSPGKNQVLSPNAQALDKVLSRPTGADEAGLNGGVRIESVCRKLTLHKNEQHPVCIV